MIWTAESTNMASEAEALQNHFLIKMASEKTPTEKAPIGGKNLGSKFCNRSTISWIISAFLVALVLLLLIEFLYPDAERKPASEHIHIYEQSTQKKRPPPVMTDYMSESLYKGFKKKPWELKFLIDPSHICTTHNSGQHQEDPEIKLLILVPSAPNRFMQRKAIRNTWGSIAKLPLSPVRLAFILGTTRNETEVQNVQEESSIYKDIIQADFEDSQNQRTTKSVLMLKWMMRSCPQAQYLLKASDDTFVNVVTIAKILGSKPFISQNRFIGGFIHNRTILKVKSVGHIRVHRVSERIPPYASGSAYMMTGRTAVELFKAAKEVHPFFPMEDMFVTGLCGKHIHVKLFHDPRFRFNDPPSPPSWRAFSSLATAHSLTPDTLHLIWNEMVHSMVSNVFNQEAIANFHAFLSRRNE